MREPISWATAAVVMAGSPALLVLVSWPFLAADGWVVVFALWVMAPVVGCVFVASRSGFVRSVGAGLVGAVVAVATLPMLLEPALRVGGIVAGSAP